MNFVLYLIFFLTIFNLAEAFEIREPLLEVPVEIYYLHDSGWSEKEILDKMDGANEILQQCGLVFKIQNKRLSAITGFLEKGSLYLISDTRQDLKKEEIRLHQHIASKGGRRVVRAVFVGAVLNLTNVFGVSRRTERHQGEIYENSFYISNQLGNFSADQTIAHELGHLLLNKGHYYLDPSPNIMQYQFPMQNREFDSIQCDKMRESPLVTNKIEA